MDINVKLISLTFLVLKNKWLANNKTLYVDFDGFFIIIDKNVFHRFNNENDISTISKMVGINIQKKFPN